MLLLDDVGEFFLGVITTFPPQKKYLFVEFVLVQLQVQTTSNYYTKYCLIKPSVAFYRAIWSWRFPGCYCFLGKLPHGQNIWHSPQKVGQYMAHINQYKVTVPSTFTLVYTLNSPEIRNMSLKTRKKKPREKIQMFSVYTLNSPEITTCPLKPEKKNERKNPDVLCLYPEFTRNKNMSLKTPKKTRTLHSYGCSAISSPLVQAVRLCKPPQGSCTVAPMYHQKIDESQVLPSRSLT